MDEGLKDFLQKRMDEKDGTVTPPPPPVPPVPDDTLQLLLYAFLSWAVALFTALLFWKLPPDSSPPYQYIFLPAGFLCACYALVYTLRLLKRLSR